MFLQIGDIYFEFLPHPLFPDDAKAVFVLEGGTAFIYKLRHVDTGDQYALKVFKRDSRNEQVATDFRLAVRDSAGQMVDTLVELQEVLYEVFVMIANRDPRGLPTGLFELDDMLNGLQDGEMIIVAARPSMGKTSFAMNIVENIATGEARLPCAVFSLEMSKQQLAQRMLCSRAEIDAHKLRKGLLNSEEYTKLANVVGELAKAPIWVDDSPGLTPLELRAKARRLKLQHDVKCIMVDYMQLMDNPGPESRQQQISEISRGIKAVSRELNIPVIALSQLNRQSEGRDGHRPRMSDLRESGSIEQDADVVMFVFREEYYHQMRKPTEANREKFAEWLTEGERVEGKAELIIGKQRHGPTGTVELQFEASVTRFGDLTHDGQLPDRGHY